MQAEVQQHHILHGGNMSEIWVHGQKPGSAGKWKDGISIIINGGKDSLESATIPIEWRFSDALIAERPQYILICDLEANPGILEHHERYYYGRRSIVKVSEFATYLQLFHSGSHYLIFIVFCGDKNSARKRAEKYLEPMNNGLGRGYEAFISSTFIEQGWSSKNSPGSSAYITTVHVELPKGLLAPKPESTFSKFIWNWSNRYYERGPVDECAYRKRKWCALIPTLISFLIGRSIAGILLSFYALTLWLLLAFAGFLPKNPLTKIKDAWTNLDAFSWNMLACKYWRRYKDAGVNKETKRYEKAKYVPILLTPCIALPLIALPPSIFYLSLRFPTEMLGIGIIAAGVIVILLIMSGITNLFESRLAEAIKREMRAFYDNRHTAVREWWAERPKKADARLIASLSAISSTNLAVPAEVDIQQVIRKVPAPIKFKLGFWVAKSKVCRPFEQ